MGEYLENEWGFIRPVLIPFDRQSSKLSNGAPIIVQLLVLLEISGFHSQPPLYLACHLLFIDSFSAPLGTPSYATIYSSTISCFQYPLVLNLHKSCILLSNQAFCHAPCPAFWMRLKRWIRKKKLQNQPFKWGHYQYHSFPYPSDRVQSGIQPCQIPFKSLILNLNTYRSIQTVLNWPHCVAHSLTMYFSIQRWSTTW